MWTQGAREHSLLIFERGEWKRGEILFYNLNLKITFPPLGPGDSRFPSDSFAFFAFDDVDNSSTVLLLAF